MATKDEIKAALLNAVGNPQTGVIADMAETIAKAVWELDNKNSATPAKEVRIIETKETR
jgi:hypothetical protein